MSAFWNKNQFFSFDFKRNRRKVTGVICWAEIENFRHFVWKALENWDIGNFRFPPGGGGGGRIFLNFLSFFSEGSKISFSPSHRNKDEYSWRYPVMYTIFAFMLAFFWWDFFFYFVMTRNIFCDAQISAPKYQPSSKQKSEKKRRFSSLFCIFFLIFIIFLNSIFLVRNLWRTQKGV